MVPEFTRDKIPRGAGWLFRLGKRSRFFESIGCLLFYLPKRRETVTPVDLCVSRVHACRLFKYYHFAALERKSGELNSATASSRLLGTWKLIPPKEEVTADTISLN